MKIHKLPFKIIMFGPFSIFGETAKRPRLQPFRMIDPDQSVAELAPRFYVPVDRELYPGEAFEFQPSRLRDFKPAGLISLIPYLRGLFEASQDLDEAIADNESAASITSRWHDRWPDLVSFLPLEAASSSDSPSQIDDILNMVSMPGDSEGISGAAFQGSLVDVQDRLKRMLIDLLNIIYADVHFKECEEAWRGLELLMEHSAGEAAEEVEIFLIPARKDLLEDNLDRLNEEWSDDAPDLVLFDFLFDSASPDMRCLKAISRFGDSLLVPVVVQASHPFFHQPSWQDIERLPYMRNYFDATSYAKWNGLRDKEESEWMTLLCCGLRVEETDTRVSAPDYCPYQPADARIINPVWAYAALYVQNIKATGWPTLMSERESASIPFETLSPERILKNYSLEVRFSMERTYQLIEIGISPIVDAPSEKVIFLASAINIRGAAFKQRLFLTHLLRFVFGLKNLYPEVQGPNEITTLVADALTAFIEQSGHAAPQKLKVQAHPAAQGDQWEIDIAFVMPPSIIAGKQEVEFNLLW